MSKSQRLRKRFSTEQNYRAVRIDNVIRRANRMYNAAAMFYAGSLGNWHANPTVRHRSARLTMLKKAQATILGAYVY